MSTSEGGKPKMTEEEMARADAEWAALPGTEPDGWSFIPEAELSTPANPYAIYRERGDLWAKDGMTYARLTAVGLPDSYPTMQRGVWMAVWRERPAKEAEFNPPVTLEPPHAAD